MRELYFLVLGLLIFSEVNAQIVNIPDANFKAKLLAASSSNSIAKDLLGKNIVIDINNDGEIQESEAQNVGELDIKSSNISSLQGISNFTKLNSLYCSLNKINSIDLEKLVHLINLNIQINNLTTIDLSKNNLIKNLSISENNITDLSIDNLTDLEILDVRSCPKLINLNCNNNLNLKVIYFDNSPLQNLFIKNGSEESISLSTFDSSSLKYVCCNENQIQDIKNQLGQWSEIKCEVNSYCSFTRGGTFYTIQGNTKLDDDNNGCDNSDPIFPNLYLKETNSNGNIIGTYISNSTGYYIISFQSGTYAVTPVLENSSYFSIFPTNTTVTFPTQSSPFIQDFCVTAIGVHSDLEIILLPILRARPGFDASYKIIYKNKGNQTQSGSVNLTFNDAILDLVTASPIVTNQNIDNLSWSFTDLKPFETREIIVTLNLNGPMETPAINGGDKLDLATIITSTLTDETPADNTFTLNQTVVNAFDPNDKTCLEGATIPPSAVGKYVHYMIRFENKGTAEAQNVVVKDMIDTSKFDISSLVVTQGSHPFVTKISEINKVEFIFENINLPFDDATNDGYVAFKIKTKPTLVVGNSFSNTASIYFDYNFPIVTNTATTSVLQSLGTNDFELESYFKIYPNPAKNSLNLDIKKQIKLSSISIYNTLGQQILVIPNAQYTKQVDVSNLKTGNYFIKLISDKGSSVGKFIKS